jgi:hypothetical protein
LHEKYKKPVFSAVLYPFKVRIPLTQISPYEEKCGDTVLLTLQYESIKLWLKDARVFVHAHAIYMYTFLPCMQYASVNLLIGAIREMDRHYVSEDLYKHLIRFYSFLLRSPTLSKGSKHKVEEFLFMQYGRDRLIETIPAVIDLVAKGKMEGRIEGEIEGETKGARQMVVKVVQMRFPALLTLAQRRVEEMADPTLLQKLVLDIVAAPDKETVRHLLLSDQTGE